MADETKPPATAADSTTPKPAAADKPAPAEAGTQEAGAGRGLASRLLLLGGPSPGSASPPRSAVASRPGGRFMYPNVLYEPPTSFKVGVPSDFPEGGRRRALQGDQRRLDRQSRRHPVRADRDLHPPGLPAGVARVPEQVQVPLSRQRLLQERHQLRGPDAAAARARQDRHRSGRRPDRRRQEPEYTQEELGQWEDPDSFISIELEGIRGKHGRDAEGTAEGDRQVADLAVDLPGRHPDGQSQARAGHARQRGAPPPPDQGEEVRSSG